MDDTNAPATHRTDRLLFETRLLAALIIPFLLTAFAILYLLPTYSGELFAWAVRPPMTAMMLGAAYLGGAYYFSRVVVAKRWHTIKLGILPVTSFASYLGIATLLHWDRFNHPHPAFILWAILYLGLPPLLLIVWLRNRSTDPGTPDSGYPPLPKSIRRLLGLEGGILVVTSLLLLLLPEVMIPIWPWALTPLTARVMAAMFILPGLVGVGIALDARWSAARIILQAQIGALVFILLAIFRATGDIYWSSVGAWLFVASMLALWLSLIGIYLWMERQFIRPSDG